MRGTTDLGWRIGGRAAPMTPSVQGELADEHTDRELRVLSKRRRVEARLQQRALVVHHTVPDL